MISTVTNNLGLIAIVFIILGIAWWWFQTGGSGFYLTFRRYINEEYDVTPLFVSRKHTVKFTFKVKILGGSARIQVWDNEGKLLWESRSFSDLEICSTELTPEKRGKWWVAIYGYEAIGVRVWFTVRGAMIIAPPNTASPN